MNTYIRTIDGAEMIELAPHQYVSRDVAELLELIGRQKDDKQTKPTHPKALEIA